LALFAYLWLSGISPKDPKDGAGRLGTAQPSSKLEPTLMQVQNRGFKIKLGT
jgi:hypothetical protein